LRRYDGNIGIWLGNGDGTFQPVVLVPIAAAPKGLVAADFNHDGITDLAVASRQGPMVGIGVLLGNGDGTFRPVVTYTPGTHQTALSVADFNLDGNADIVAVDSDDITAPVTILLGNGDGTFRSTGQTYNAVFPEAVAVGDFNRDGKPDFVAANFGPNQLQVFLGNGDGTFQQTPVVLPTLSFIDGTACRVGDGSGERA